MNNEFILINDTRTKFSKLTFSKYKKTLVLKKLNQAIYYQKMEEAFFWTCELICSHLYLELWNLYIVFACKHIHIDNPKLPILLWKKFKDFRQISQDTSNDYLLRNNNTIRTLFCSITMILSLSNKFTILDDLNYKFNFKVENIYENLKAPNMKFIEFVYKQHDPKEFIIPFNELIYHLQESNNKIDINYWINWIIFYDSLCSSKKNYILCQQRDLFISKNEKQSKNIIWILWDILLKIKDSKPKQIQVIVENLFELFRVKYTVACNKRRKYIIYNVIELYLHHNIDTSIPLIKNNKAFDNLEYNINIIFDQLKKNEDHSLDASMNEAPISQKEKKMMVYEKFYNNL